MLEALFIALLILSVAVWWLFKANKNKAQTIATLEHNRVQREIEFEHQLARANFQAKQVEKVAAANNEAILDALDQSRRPSTQIKTDEPLNQTQSQEAKNEDDEDSDYAAVTR